MREGRHCSAHYVQYLGPIIDGASDHFAVGHGVGTTYDVGSCVGPDAVLTMWMR